MNGQAARAILPGSAPATGPWLRLIEAHAGDMSLGVSEAELRVRLARVSRFAQDVGGRPEDVTAERFETWTGTLERASVSEYVKSLRRFYEWAVETGRCATNPLPARAVPRHYSLDAKWRDAIEAFTRYETVAGIGAGTIKRRVNHVRRFASSSPVSPWLVSADDYRVWVVELEVSATSLLAVRDSLRAFYRWAAKEGRVRDDPTLEPSGRYRTLGVPDQWDVPLRQYKAYLVGRGLSPQTVRLHGELMRNFARDHAEAEPFSIAIDDIFEYFAGKRWKRETLRTRRQVLRSFYRWATITGRCDLDPTENMPIVRPGDLGRVDQEVSLPAG